MADNVSVSSGSATYIAAADEASYSGDTAKIQLTRLVHVSGAEGSKTITEVVGTAGAPGTAVMTIQGVSGGTVVPISVASIPSHAVTNAGTFAVQESGAALTALQLIDNLVLAEDAAHASGDPGVQALAVRNDSDASLAGTTGDYTPLQVDANGYLKVNIKAGAGSGGTAMTDDAAFTAGTTSVTPIGAMFDAVATDSVDENDCGIVRMSANRNLFVNIRDNAGNERGLNIDASGNITVATIGTSVTPGTSAANLGKAIDAAVGSSDTGVLALVQRADTLSTLTPANGDYVPLRTTSTGALWVQNAGSSAVQQDDAAFTPGTSYVAVLGATADETSTDSVDEGDGGAVRMTLDRKLITTPQPHTQGGLSVSRSVDLDETKLLVKGSAGQLYGGIVTNRATATRWIRFYNAASTGAVTVGTTTPVCTIGIPGNATDNIAAVLNAGGYGIEFTTGIVAAATTGYADNDTGAPGANDLIVNFFYK